MNSFQLYFKLGLQHILDIQGFDHILFVLALCAVYVARDWKKILILVTAFTIGHSLTLALATFNVIQIRADVIEFLIPVTIAFTALITLFKPKPSSGKGIQLNYLFAVFFGLIHGLGFSNYLKALLGKETSIWQPLLSFNIGLEVGQIIIVAAFLLLTSLVNLAGVNRKEWTLVVSAFVLGIACMLMLETKFW
ncbi:HupE/UreJ family protein [Algoriphagus sp.]|jgi:Na+-transporting NADH:ubiquinone oxidoreductase subunit NqrB|uniref:HupE/UreJ family protein n=1 Tax=Algoriphagus sp. TaxID=1872435 RepID=UPI0027256ADA|nr:HupE/UreJ family protein [Algoriphagus sp.]MDO8965681.1 HupE/UreJ family protein [Algoriphagus sp.]MDP3199049.1 HupE/UreJ family protein [Algoriphagus sp.]